MLMHVLQNHPSLETLFPRSEKLIISLSILLTLVISTRYLQPGHSFLPNASEFGDVECVLKWTDTLYTAKKYIDVMENCRRQNKFEVRRMSREDFLSVKLLEKLTTNRKVDIHKKKSIGFPLMRFCSNHNFNAKNLIYKTWRYD